MPCSRELSRIARGLAKERGGSSLPPACPLRSERDLLAFQEKQKKAVRSNFWRCKLCGKTFVSEFYLDLHFDRKHEDTLSNATDAVCLGDYCLALDCASAPKLSRTPLARTPLAKRKKKTVKTAKRSAAFASSCDPATFADSVRDCTRLFESCAFETRACDDLRCADGRVSLVAPDQLPAKPPRELWRGLLYALFIALYYLAFYFFSSRRRRNNKNKRSSLFSSRDNSHASRRRDPRRED